MEINVTKKSLLLIHQIHWLIDPQGSLITKVSHVRARGNESTSL